FTVPQGISITQCESSCLQFPSVLIVASYVLHDSFSLTSVMAVPKHSSQVSLPDPPLPGSPPGSPPVLSTQLVIEYAQVCVHPFFIIVNVNVALLFDPPAVY